MFNEHAFPEQPKPAGFNESNLPGQWMGLPADLEISDEEGNPSYSLSDFSYQYNQNRGSYAHNNGVLLLIDHDGSLHITKYNQETLNSLMKTGYKSTSFHVPFSADSSVPTNPAMKQQWEDLTREVN